MADYGGLLFVGDPHISSRAPSSRRDDYAATVLGKLRWCLDYAREENLLPCLLGDLFHHKWERQLKLIGDLASLFAGREVLTIYGNHDITEGVLTEGQALSLLVRAELLTLVDERLYWSGTMNGQKVMVGGTSFDQAFPLSFRPGYPKGNLVFWLSHTELQAGNVRSPGEYFEVEGIDVIVNGHLHQRGEDVQVRTTRWITPGNITRESRATRQAPAVLRIDVDTTCWTQRYIEVPHEPEEVVFSPKKAFGGESEDIQDNLFVTSLRNRREMLRRGSARGENLQAFLQDNKEDFDEDVYARISKLAEEVLAHAE